MFECYKYSIVLFLSSSSLSSSSLSLCFWQSLTNCNSLYMYPLTSTPTPTQRYRTCYFFIFIDRQNNYTHIQFQLYSMQKYIVVSHRIISEYVWVCVCVLANTCFTVRHFIFSNTKFERRNVCKTGFFLFMLLPYRQFSRSTCWNIDFIPFILSLFLWVCVCCAEQSTNDTKYFYV